jgi:arylsulfatase A-like enzyme
MGKLSLLGLELALLAYPCVIVALPVFVLLESSGSGWRSSGGTLRLARWIGALAALWLPALAYAASWATLRSTGHFLNASMVRVWWSNPVQILQHASHMEPLTIVVAVIGTLAFAGGVGWLLYRTRGPRGGRWGWTLTGAAVALVAACLLLPDKIGWAAVDGFLRARRAEATGPLVGLVADARSRSMFSQDSIFQRVEPLVHLPPIVPMSEYVTGLPHEWADEGAASSARRYNVLLVVVESLRSDQLVTFGGDRTVMPTVDAIAASGRRFTRHYTQASHSDYADPTILSSHYPLRSNVYHVYPDVPPYPRVLIYDVLASLGYRAGIFSSQNEAWGGMKHYLDTGSLDRFLHSETYDGPTYVPDRDEGFAGWAKGTRRSGKIDDRFTVNEAIQWIGEAEEPFVIYMNLQNSHVPYVVPSDFDPPFGSGQVSFPILFGSFPEDSIQAVKDLYASSLAYVDYQLARLVSFLEGSGLMSETVIVITSDTGQAFYEHGFTSHAGALYDEVMHVPLVIRSPGLEPGDESGLSQHIDIPPTVLGLMGLPPHPSFQGVDLLAPSADERGGRSIFLVGQALEDQYSLVEDRWKLIFDAKLGEYQLYDLEVDPGEVEDLAMRRPEIAAALATRLQGWRKAQLQYYSDPIAYRSTYPPRVRGMR